MMVLQDLKSFNNLIQVRGVDTSTLLYCLNSKTSTQLYLTHSLNYIIILCTSSWHRIVVLLQLS